MNNRAELPIIEPVFGTYHYQCAATAVIASNPSIRNWVLNENVSLCCGKGFLSGMTTPRVTVILSSYDENPYLERNYFDLRIKNFQFNAMVRHQIDNGYYVYFNKIDDYYLDGKTWYKQRHFFHDGIICGYDQEKKLYCVYAYDNKWILNKFWMPQKSFNAGIRSMRANGENGCIFTLKPLDTQVKIDPRVIVNNLRQYLASSFEKYPKTGPGIARGTVIHDYITLYLDMLLDGSIPYERMDWRVLRLIWEHKKIMLERIERVEEILCLGTEISTKYKSIVEETDKMRMLYAAYHLKRRDSLLVSIRDKLIPIKEKEKDLLNYFIKKVEEKI